MEETDVELSSAVSGGRVDDVEEVIFNDESEDDFQTGLSQELLELRLRAKKLSEDLKLLSSAANEMRRPSQDQNTDFEEIMKRYSDYVESDDEEDTEFDEKCRKINVEKVMKKLQETNLIENQRPDSKKQAIPQDPKNDETQDSVPISESLVTEVKEMTDEEALEEAWSTIRNFKPKRPRGPSPTYPDLSVEDEKRLRTRIGGSGTFWHMPFRHSQFEASAFEDKQENSSDDEEPVSRVKPILDPLMYTPSGDVYSYFVRRRVTPHAYTSPLNHAMANALGGPARKLDPFIIA